MKYGYWLAYKESKPELIQGAYALPSLNGLKEHIWSLKTSFKIRSFLWRAMSGAISVAKLIAIRGMKFDLRFQACKEEEESTNHVLFTCPLA